MLFHHCGSLVLSIVGHRPRRSHSPSTIPERDMPGRWGPRRLTKTAGLLMLAGPVDLDGLDKWIRVGWERRRVSRFWHLHARIFDFSE